MSDDNNGKSLNRPPPPEIADAFARGDFAGVADWASREGDFARLVRRGQQTSEPPRSLPPVANPQIDAMKRLLNYRPFGDWLFGALVAVFMAFVVEVLQWRSYDGIVFRHNHGWLALFGLWLLCYWAVLAARRLWAARS